MIISKGFGIDLGTTNSAAAMMDLTDAGLILADDAQLRATMPSAVAFHPKKGEVVVGMEAFQRRGMAQNAPVLSIKRKMGYPGGALLDGKEESPPYLSSLILRAIRERMESKLERALPHQKFRADRAVITFPARFKQPSIEATREAGRLAKIEVLELLHEPTAAAIYYCWKHGINDGAFMVVDLGGGTFDVSILRRVAGEFTVLGTGGDEHLGGDDFDKALARRLLEILQRDYDLSDFDPHANEDERNAFEKLILYAEGVKKELSANAEVWMNNQNLFPDRSGENVILDSRMTRDEFEGLIREKANRIAECCDAALADANEKHEMTAERIDAILLAGGSCRIPLVQETVRRAFCTGEDGRPRARCESPLLDEPDTCVAQGAAIRAAAIGGVVLYDDAESVKLTLHGEGGTVGETYTVSGRAESLSAKADLSGGRIRLTGGEGSDFSQEAVLDSQQGFKFRNAPLKIGATNDFGLELADSAGRVLARFGRSVAQSAERRDIGGLTSPSVLARPILLGVVERGRWARYPLFEAGASLPVRKSFTFYTTDQSGQATLPLYEQHRIIKTIEAEVPTSLDVGSAVFLEVECNEMYYLMVRGKAGGVEFAARVEPPPPPTVPSRADVEALCAKFEEQLPYSPQEERMVLRGVFLRLNMDIEEAFQNEDAPKLIERAGELEALTLTMGREVVMEPPWERFERLVQECNGIVDAAGKTLVGFDVAEGRKYISTERRYAQEAYDAKDQQRYGERFTSLAGYRDYIRQRIEERIRPQRESSDEEQAQFWVKKAGETVSETLNVALAKREWEAVNALEELSRQLEGLESRALQVPQEVVRECRLLYREAQKWEKRLQERRVGRENTTGGLSAG